MKLKENFVIHKTDEQYVLIDCTGAFSGMIKCNKTCAYIIDCLQNEITESELADKMFEKYDASIDVIKNNVHDIICKLKEVDAIDE